MKRPVVELSDCIACAVCEAVCPDVFCLSEAGYVQVADLFAYPEQSVDEAIKNCPSKCIYWKDDDF
ncbi:MAG: ferredoxin [Desulfosalsimonadaceae bacterium]